MTSKLTEALEDWIHEYVWLLQRKTPKVPLEPLEVVVDAARSWSEFPTPAQVEAALNAYMKRPMDEDLEDTLRVALVAARNVEDKVVASVVADAIRANLRELLLDLGAEEVPIRKSGLFGWIAPLGKERPEGDKVLVIRSDRPERV